jgi:hypothetical protein
MHVSTTRRATIVVVATHCASRHAGPSSSLLFFHNRTKHAGLVKQLVISLRAGTTAPAAKHVKLVKSCLLQAAPEGRDVRLASIVTVLRPPEPLISFPGPCNAGFNPASGAHRSIWFQNTTMVTWLCLSAIKHIQHHAASCGGAVTQPRAKYVSLHPRVVMANGNFRCPRLRRLPARLDASLQLR